MKTLKPQRGRSLVDFMQYNFGEGINIQDSPQEIADSELTAAVNVYLSTEGDVLQRNGMTRKGPAVPGGGGLGIVRFAQNVVGGKAEQTAQTVMQVGTNLVNADTGYVYGNIGTTALPMSTAQIFDPSYNGGTDLLVICTDATGPYAFDGTNVVNYNPGPTTVTGARWCLVLNDILWLAGIESDPNLVVGSVPGQPESVPGYGTFATSTPVTGLGVIGVGLQSAVVAGLQVGVALITGFTPDSYTYQEIPNEDGVTSGLSMITIDGILYLVGNYAIYRYDGVNFTEISRKVRPWLQASILYPQFPMNGNRQLSWAMYYNRRIYFWYCSNSTVPNTALVWDLARQGWTIYSSVTLAGGCALNAVGDPDPATFVVCDAKIGQQYQFDTYTNTQRNVTDDTVPINAYFQSKFFKIGMPGTPKTLLRTTIELFALPQQAGVFSVTTDYGATVSDFVTLFPTKTIGGTWGQFDWGKAAWGQVVPLTSSPYPPNTLVWGQGVWGKALWAPAAAPYFKERFDWNLQGEAFAFSFSTPPKQTTPTAPWRFMGLTGRFSQQARV